MRHKDGSYRWAVSHGEAMRHGDDRPVRMVGSITDITEHQEYSTANQGDALRAEPGS